MGKMGRVWDWIKNLWEFYDIASKVLPAALIVAGVVAAVLRALGTWGLTEMLVPYWVLAGLGLTALGSLLAVAWRFVTAERASKRTPFNVYDTACDHMWRLNISPTLWIEHDLEHGLSPQYLDAVASGPFHAAKHCGNQLYTDRMDRDGTPMVLGRCDRCSMDTPLKPAIESMGRPLPQRNLQRKVLLELQRIHRTGGKIQSNMKFRAFT